MKTLRLRSLAPFARTTILLLSRMPKHGSLCRPLSGVGTTGPNHGPLEEGGFDRPSLNHPPSDSNPSRQGTSHLSPDPNSSVSSARPVKKRANQRITRYEAPISEIITLLIEFVARESQVESRNVQRHANPVGKRGERYGLPE